jgi:HD-like signal output (HDOD) protein
MKPRSSGTVEEPHLKARRDLTAREIQQVREAIRRRLGDTSVPTLPQVAMRIIELVANPEAAVTDFTEVIQADQALTGRLLRMANSAAFGQRKPVTRIERAMVLLGLQRLKALALGFHLSKAAAVGDDSLSSRRLWTQSLYRGWLGLRIAETYSRRVAGEAFIVGLLADAGLPMMPKLVGVTFNDKINLEDPPAKRFLDESMRLPFTHADVTAALCELWKLPELLTFPLANHHTFPSRMSWDDPRSAVHSIACFVGSIPLDPAGAPVSGHPFRKLAQRLLGLSADEIEPLIAQAAEDFEACKSMFSHVLDESLSIDQIVDEASSHLVLADGSEEVAPDLPAPERVCQVHAPEVFEVDGLRLELEATGGAFVTVYIADDRGTRLLSERVRPADQKREDICRVLMLDDAPSAQVDEIIDRMLGLAA